MFCYLLFYFLFFIFLFFYFFYYFFFKFFLFLFVYLFICLFVYFCYFLFLLFFLFVFPPTLSSFFSFLVVHTVNEDKRDSEKEDRMKVLSFFSLPLSLSFFVFLSLLFSHFIFQAIADKFGIKDLIQEGRKLQMEGKVSVMNKKDVKKDRFLVLFNDLILVLKVFFFRFFFLFLFLFIEPFLNLFFFFFFFFPFFCSIFHLKQPTKAADDRSLNEQLLFKIVASADLQRSFFFN